MEKYVITGGPGTGKSTLVRYLAGQGFATVGEAARTIIRAEQAKAARYDGYAPIVPWADFEHFQALVSNRIARQQARVEGPVFADRDQPDAIGYFWEQDEEPPAYLLDRILRRPPTKVFLLDPLHYAPDAERVEDAERAQRLHELIAEGYRWIGADVTRVPRFSEDKHESLDARTRFILDSIEPAQGELEAMFRTEESIRERIAHPFVPDGERTYDTRQAKLGGYSLRSRDGTITLKGPLRGEPYKHRSEREWDAPRLAGIAARVPIGKRWQQYRASFRVIGDPNASLAIDTIPGVGTFAEIEAASHEQIRSLSTMLGFEDPIPMSKYDLINAS